MSDVFNVIAVPDWQQREHDRLEQNTNEARRRWALQISTQWATDFADTATVEDIERWAQRAERFALTGSFGEGRVV